MKIEQLAVEALISYALNSRTHDDAQVAQIEASIQHSRPLACLVANDTLPLPTGLYVIRPNATDEFLEALDQMVKAKELAS